MANGDRDGTERIVTSTKEVADHFRKTVMTISRWKKQGMPVLGDGSYDILAIERWVMARKGLVPPPLPQGPDMEEKAAPVASVLNPESREFWDRENKKHHAGLRELELRKKKGELIERIIVEDEFLKRILEVKRGLVSLERALPPELIACRSEREMSVVIRRCVRETLLGFSRPLPAGMTMPQDQPPTDGVDLSDAE